MDINRLTEKTQEALHAAQSDALRRGNQQVDVEHLLAALLSQEGGLAASILKRAGANVESLGLKPRPGSRSTAQSHWSYRHARPDLRHAAPEQALHQSRGRGQAAQGRVHLRRARSARGRRRFKGPQGTRRHPRSPHAGASRSSRQPARHQQESRSHLRSARKIWPRPDQERRSRQARSRHRPR